MGRVANSRLAARWRVRVERQRQSGVSILEYCRREGVSAASFHSWKRRLHASPATGKRKSRQPTAQHVSKRNENGPLPRGGFVQFPVATAALIEVRFADGTQVHLPAENLAALTVILKTLQSSQHGEASNA